MEARFLSSIHDISSDRWNQLCGTDYPFLRHEFFAALEDSGSTTRASGWKPYHLLLESDGKPLGIMPLFLKYHSYGEYVFDWSWADAWHSHGYDYYPKFLSAIPFTPATGPRWGLDLSAHSRDQLIDAMFAAIRAEAERLELSSCHWLFTHPEENACFDRRGYLRRTGCQYHWLNRNYQSFDEFLATFTSRKRKSLNRERRKVSEQGITLELKEGADISPQDWHLFYQFYHLTYFKRSGRQGYLTEEFFPLIAQQLSDHLMMAQAFHQGRMIAAALYFKDSHTLYGRYWGCLQEYDQLHFETCYYQGIDYAIRQGLQRFDPGAQGEHKIQRGFTPVLTYSYHWVGDTAFAQAIKNFLASETHQITRYRTLACERLPFKAPDQ